jgi:hypothetical protein
MVHTISLNFATRCTAILSFAAVLRSLASTLAFTGVFAFATVVPGFASALSFTRILALAAMFPFVLVRQVVQGREGSSGDAHRVRPHGKRPGQETGYGCSGNDCFGW